MGLPARLPIFIGPLGAVTSLRRSPGDAGRSGIIALAGPALGTVAALLCFLLAGAANPGYARYLLLALAYFGCFLNLINLIPVGFLDGAKVADAIPKWMNVLGLLVVAGVVLLFGNPIGLIFLVLGIFHTIGRFRRSNQTTDPAQAAASRRLGLGAAYVAILVVAAAGHVDRQHGDRQQQLRPRREPEHGDDRPLRRRRRGRRRRRLAQRERERNRVVQRGEHVELAAVLVVEAEQHRVRRIDGETVSRRRAAAGRPAAVPASDPCTRLPSRSRRASRCSRTPERRPSWTGVYPGNPGAANDLRLFLISSSALCVPPCWGTNRVPIRLLLEPPRLRVERRHAVRLPSIG